ncbi:hypothetical protein TNCV_1904191 [Trichonephila clavipes]|nr:hypothetical protein TNCV_1904191 [Trichonephila clavipes]
MQFNWENESNFEMKMIRLDFPARSSPFTAFFHIDHSEFFDKLPSVPNELITNQPAYDPAVPSSQKRPRALLEHEFINFPQAKRLRVQI